MKQLRRIIINALTVLSLVICAATLIIWLQSYGRAVELREPIWRCSVNILNGHFFKAEYVTYQGKWENWVVTKVLWQYSAVPVFVPIIMLSALPPLLWARKQLAHFVQWAKGNRRSRLGLCPSCNYDLRATPDRCPECGTIPAKAGLRQ
jgi:hypothetical protein